MSKKNTKPEKNTKKAAVIEPDTGDEQENAHETPISTITPFPVVGIGASAGGLNAYSKLLKALPIDTGMAFVLVQHLDPKHASMLPELLGRTTLMPVIEIKDGMHVEPNSVYVMPPNYSLAILHGRLHLMPRPDAQGKHLPIDDFLRTLADDLQSNAIGVILSGTASDGTFGLRAIKAEGGITFAQSEASCEYDGMPHSAIVAGHVDFILPPEEIALELSRIAKHPYLQQEFRLPKEGESPLAGDSLNKIFVLLRTRTGNDFTYYKHATIRRRVKRRMVLNQIERMEDYVKYLQQQPKELDALFQDFLINVTSFFRDPETFEALKTEVFPQMLQGRGNVQPLRIWIPGCSTGEEVYSIAIALFEYLGENISGTRIQIFASDIDNKAVDKARAGHYPEGIRDNVTAERLQCYFVKTPEGYQICKSIRDICVFAVQNVIKDPPFSRLDLVCCRNLMIYLGAVLQKKVLHTFHYALSPGGYLMLGTSETIGSYAELFSLVDKKNKIYLKKSVALRMAYEFNATPYVAPTGGMETIASGRQSPALNLQQEADNLILANYGPPGVIINQELQILNFRGQTGPYIEPAAGSASLNLLKMARQDLVMELRSVVHEAIKEHRPVRKDGVRIQQQDGAYRLVNLQVMPLAPANAAESFYLVLFEAASGPISAAKKAGKAGKSAAGSADESEAADPRDLRINELEHELFSNREYMQSIIESHEASNEELQSANEEIQSANEELQSTNEELETAKEELQSTNEELATINEEHEIHNQELITANNDLSNLLASVELAIVILREDMSIRRFTPAARQLLNLIDADVGRPIGNIRANVTIPDLENRVRQVASSMVAQSLEVKDRDGHWFVLRIRPYKTLDNRIEGVVMTFIDIDSVKDAERLRRALQHERRLAAVVRDSSDAVTVQDFSGRILAWNRRAEVIYGYTEAEALQLDSRVLIADRSLDDMKNVVQQLQLGKKVSPCESWRRRKDGREIKVWLTVSILLDEAEKPAGIVLTEREIT
ncbi:MAG TPA: chemotaxis protein CheB [Gallionellaceae bacterium]|nr:chemotaxis protein CheB [Gallionellaceae bacterium]